MNMYARIYALLPLLIGVGLLVAVITIVFATYPRAIDYEPACDTNHDNEEVSATKYRIAWCNVMLDERFRAPTRAYLADGKLTQAEYRSLQQLEEQLKIDDARMELQQALAPAKE